MSELLKNYRRSADGKSFTRNLSSCAERLQRTSTRKKDQSLIGDLYQHICEYHYVENTRSDGVFLGQEDTFNVFKKLYPQHDVLRSSYGIDNRMSLDVGMPDGLLFEGKPVTEPEIDLSDACLERVYEFTLRKNRFLKDYVLQKSRNFEFFKMAHPDFFMRAKLTVVIPKSTHGEEILRKLLVSGVADYDTMPFFRNDISRYYYRLQARHKTDNHSMY